MKEEKITQLVIRLPEELHHEFKIYALRNRQSMTEIIEKCIEELLEQT